MNKIWITLLLICVVSVASWFYLVNQKQAGTVTLQFQARVGDKPLKFNQTIYPNPGGEGQFQIRNIQLYLSNIQLQGKTHRYQLTDSYHLARFDNASKSYLIEFHDVPYDQYSKVMISIGVDESANSSIMPRGDLDPNNRMAWSWEVGYKFILFEGTLAQAEKIQPLVYHVGFSENYKPLEFQLPKPITPEGARINFDVDILAMFNSSETINMVELPTVKFDRKDARLIAENYASMVTLSADSTGLSRPKKVDK
ncbi:MbnP family protein [Thalassotalea fonticola]|uniref:MbnP family protein n=1 Tax=Thalassotalea fonticola TaxID=3065649 RepID=A0ABZ0GUU3_9GAMM|nr:MbnP family protein [Colwelliaceae bacterium S1-1]